MIDVLAIRTDFKHHGEDHGYKQILKGIKPKVTLGINERDPSEKHPILYQKYQWLFEFKAAKFKDQVDILHILYGEDYFRWSTRLFKKIPVIATFHQPADTLENEVLKGNVRGRIGQLTHSLNKNRFRKLAAAIVTSNSQKEVLKNVMDEDKIHVIPLGIHLDEINKKYEERQQITADKPSVITLGNWLRDWPFYFEVVKKCPDWNFHLINRRLDDVYKQECASYPNLTFYDDIEDAQVDKLLLEADLQFLPVTGIAASNAIIQAFGLGCPLVLTDIDKESEYNNSEIEFVKTYENGSIEDCIAKLSSFVESSAEEKQKVERQAHMYAQDYSWSTITKRTTDLYKSVLK